MPHLFTKMADQLCLTLGIAGGWQTHVLPSRQPPTPARYPLSATRYPPPTRLPTPCLIELIPDVVISYGPIKRHY